MSGIRVFTSLGDALREGYQVYDRTPTGYLVRIRTAAGWAIAFVELKKDAKDHMTLADPDAEC